MTVYEQRQAVLYEARTWMGTPFHQNACLKGVGVDCGRFLAACYAAVGISVPMDLPHWPVDWAHHKLADGEPYLQVVSRYANEVIVPLAADFAMFRFGRAFSHSALVMEWPMVMHVMDHARVELADATKIPLEGHTAKFFSVWGEQQ